MKILISGAAGFIASYLIPELLQRGHKVVGIDNYSRYGKIKKPYDSNPNYTFAEFDIKDTKLLIQSLSDCDYFVAAAAKVGGIKYFHENPYDIFIENELITISSCNAGIYTFKKCNLKKIIFLSSSMVFESADIFPTPESILSSIAPPKTSYGFQKLSTEYAAKMLWDQYKLPYTIIRPSNVVGVGDEIGSSSHVVPDLIQKILINQSPIDILGDGKQRRDFIYAKDLAKGITKAIFSSKSINQDFNMATGRSITIIELAEIIWKKIHPEKPFTYKFSTPYKYDIPRSILDISKAQKMLGFKAETTLEEILDELILWIKNKMHK